jgi:hypothetical protein
VGKTYHSKKTHTIALVTIQGKVILKKPSNTFARIRGEPIIEEKLKFQALLGFQENPNTSWCQNMRKAYHSG